MTTLQEMYQRHHSTAREEGFSIMKQERGEMFRNALGQGKTLCDIGCRDGSLTAFFAQGNSVLGIDIDAHSLKKAHERLGIDTLVMDLQGEWKELEGKMFDGCSAGEVLEHVYYPEEVIQKVKAHLNKGAVFVGSVPNAFSLINRIRYLCGTKRHTPLSDPTHINHFTVKEMKEMLERHFSRVEIVGLGRHTFLARKFPQWFAFDIGFIAHL